MLQTVKSSFLFLIILTMFSTVFAADNNADKKQPETIIHKAGIQVKSALINDGVYSRQHMDSQGKPIDETRRTGTYTGATQQYRTAPISTWTTEDYINASPNNRRNALLNMGSYQSNISKHTQRGAIIIGEGGEEHSEMRTAPINTWTKEQYLNTTPPARHNAINNMQKEPLVAPGGETNVEQRTKPIGDYSQEELLNITPEYRQKALTSASRSFRVGGRSHNNTTINLDPDTWYSEASWNLYDSTAGAYYYSANQTFSSSAAVAVTLNLLPGSYSVDVWDAYSDGGTSGSVVAADETTLVSWTSYAYSAFGQFGFTVTPPQFDVTVNLDPDTWYSEASWNLYDSTAGAYYYSAAQTFSSGTAIAVTLALAGGTYSVDVWDSYSDGGTSGSVASASGDVLVSWTSYAYSAFGQFGFSIGLFENTITLDPDTWYSEASWNLYDSTAGAYHYATNQTFSSSAAITVTEHLAAGHYSVDVWDSYSDGGTSGSVADANGNELVSWTSYAYTAFGQFGFEVLVPSDAPGLFFSEWIEGSSYNKAIELYNPTEDTIWLDNYAFPNVSNAPTTTGEYEYWNTFDAGAYVLPGGVFVLAHSDADSAMLQAADMTSFSYFSNGDDGFALVKGGTWVDADADGSVDAGEMTGFTVLDWIGNWDGDPGSGWDVAGVTAATKDHTIIRKADVIWGNSSWTSSAGTDSADSEWTVHDQNYSTNLGGHPDDPCWGNVLAFWGRDSYGDGWNGGNYELTDADGNVVAAGTGPLSGNTAWTQFEDLCVEGGVYTLTFNTVSYGYEVNYYMTNASGDTVLSCFGCMANNQTNTYPLGVNAPALSTGSLDFDGLVLNDSDTGEMQVTNAGWGAAAAMTLDSVSSSGASISVSATGLPISLDAGGSASVSVTYSPIAAGANEDYVIFTHSGPSSPDSVMVSGFGVDAYFYEGFDPFVSAPGLPMDGWTILDNNGDADTIPELYKTWYPYDYSGNGTMAATSVYSNGYWADETMITPLMHTPDLAKLSFKTYDYTQYLDVAYSVDGTTFVDLASVYVDGFWQQHDISLPEVDSLWVSFTFDPDSGSGNTYLYFDEVKAVPLPNTYISGFVYDQDTDLGLGGVSVELNGTALTTTGGNTLFLDSGFEDSSFVGSYLTTTSGWWVYPPELTNFAHMTDGDLIWVDTSAALGTNELSVLEGDRALKMWGQYTETENYTSIYQQIGAVEEGTEMYIGAWAMTHSDGPLTDGNAFFVAINWLDSGFGWLGQDQSEQMDTSYAVDQWHYVDVHGTAPANVAYVQLQLTFYQPVGYASGSVYVDKTRATMTPGHYAYRGMDAGSHSVAFRKDDYNSAVFNDVGVTDVAADTTWLYAGLAPENMTEFVADFEAGSDSGSTIISSGSASFMVMDSLRLTVTDSTVYTDTTSTGADTTWTVYDTTEYNVDPYMGDGMLVYGPTGQGGVYEDSAYAMWVSGDPIDITDYMAEGGNLSMNYRYNINVEYTGDNFYVGVMLDDDSTVWWGDYNDHTGTTSGSWYYGSADLSWLRELDDDSSTTATPVIIFESNDSLVVGWGGAFDEFHVTGNPWFLPLPGHLHAESFGSYVPLSWDEPMSSGRVSYELHSFNMGELGGSQPPTIQTRTITSYYDNSAMPRDAVSYGVQRRYWDGGTGHIGEWTPLGVTSMTSYLDFDVSEGDRADYRINVRFEDGDMATPSNIAHARVGVPYVMLVDSFATTATFDSTFGEHWEIWSTDTTGATSWVIGDSAAAHSSTGYTGTLGSNYIPEHPDSAGTFAYISNGQTQGRTVLMTPFLDFGGHASALLELDAFAMTYGTFYDPEVYTYADHAAVYVRSQSEPWHLAINLTYSHNADGWVQERADLGGLVGHRDRVQFAIVWNHGTSNNFYGDALAIDDFSVKTLAGPTNLTAASTTENVTLNWMGVDGRRANEYGDLLSAEEKELSSQSLNTINGKMLSQNGSMNRSLATDDDVMVTNNSRDTGDDISDPFILTIPESGDTLITGSTVGFTNDYDAVCPYSGSTSPDVVYKLVLADSINGLVIDLCESYYDSKVYMYLEDSLATGDTTNIACNDDYCTASHGQSWTSYIELGHQLFGGVSAGTYYIVVDGYGGSSGEYLMDVKIMTPPPDMVYNVFKDDQMVAVDLPDSVFTYTDNNVSLMESAYWVNAGRIMELSSERPFYGPPDYDMPLADFVVGYVQTDHSNHVWAAMENMPPGAFALVTPPDGEELVITHDNISSAQIFAWSTSVDPNGSTVTYHAALQLAADSNVVVLFDTTSTAIIVPYAAIADVMTPYAQLTGNYDADFIWTVYADDGWDVVQASNGPRSISVDIGWYLGMNDEAVIPDVFALHQNYPNPFNPVTTIRYDIPEQALVRIDIYNILGQKVAVLVEGLHEPGFHAVRWNGTNMYGNALSSGMYFYHIKAGDFRNVKKLLLVK